MYPDKTASVPLEGRIHLSGGERGGQSLSYIWNENISEEMSLRSFEKKEYNGKKFVLKSSFLESSSPSSSNHHCKL